MAQGFPGQRLPYTIEIFDNEDPPQPAQVDGVPVHASSDQTVLRLEVAADGMSGVAVLVAPGVGRVSVSIDADLGAGTEAVTGVSEDVAVTLDPAKAASTIRFTFGPAETPAP